MRLIIGEVNLTKLEHERLEIALVHGRTLHGTLPCACSCQEWTGKSQLTDAVDCALYLLAHASKFFHH